MKLNFRRSTAILIAVWVVTLIMYIVVRPEPKPQLEMVPVSPATTAPAGVAPQIPTSESAPTSTPSESAASTSEGTPTSTATPTSGPIPQLPSVTLPSVVIPTAPQLPSPTG